jgi:hypothetical protein
MAKKHKRAKTGRKRKLLDDLSSQQQQIEEIRVLLDDVLVAQHRTNQLLELALRAGFDDDERVRSS